MRWLIRITRTLKKIFTKESDIDTEHFPGLSAENTIQDVLEYLKMLGILPSNATTTYLNQLVQVSKADAKINYVPQKFHPVPITLLRASEVDGQDREILSNFPQSDDWGWNKFSSSEVDLHFIPGDHVTMMVKPHVHFLAERLGACIQKAILGFFT
jgi:thioesterase domain-containing protein